MKKSITIVFLMIIFIFGATFLFFNLNQKLEINNSDVPVLTIALDWTPNTNHTGLFVAKKLHYFEDEGINVNILQPPEGGATSLVASGKVQFGVDFQDFLAPALASTSPLPVKAIAAIVQHNTSGIISKKDKNVLSPKDMEFKSYATWDNPIEHSFLKYLMKKDNANFNNINLIHASIDNIPSALRYNIDCAWAYYGSEAIATDFFGVDYNFFFFKDIDPVLDYYAPIIISNVEYLKKEPQNVKKFLKAVSRGYNFAAENPDMAAEIFLDSVPELNHDLIKKSQKWLSPKYIDDSKSWGTIDKSRWEGFFKWLYHEGIIDSDILGAQSFTNEFLPECK